MVLIENPGWSADPQQNSLWILEPRWRFTCIQRGGRHFASTGVFSTADVPRNTALNSCASFPVRKPHWKEDKDVGKGWGESRMEGWAHAIFLPWAKLLWQFVTNVCKTANKPEAAKQKQEENPPLQFSHPGVPPWDRRVLRDCDK